MSKKKLSELLPEECFELDDNDQPTEEIDQIAFGRDVDFECLEVSGLLAMIEHHPNNAIKNAAASEIRRRCGIGASDSVLIDCRDQLISVCTQILQTADNRASVRLDFVADFICALTKTQWPKEAAQVLKIEDLRWGGKNTIILNNGGKRFKFNSSPNSTRSAVRTRRSPRSKN